MHRMMLLLLLLKRTCPLVEVAQLVFHTRSLAGRLRQLVNQTGEAKAENVGCA